ncbi:MAG TPA: 2,3-dehydroadipyl-CoA hydratase [Rhodobacteraceae bacterium]|nr:2,3-dehydroadipyl-CoA hydratase [Paracoccaceae bacterium]
MTAIDEARFRDIRVCEAAPGVLQVILHRPGARNALRTGMLGEIATVLGEAQSDDRIACVVITGGETVFAAGADIGEMKDKTPVDVLNDPRLEAWRVIRGFAKPLIGAVNGYCLGGGHELALLCDIVIAGHSARFGQPEVNLGIIPGAGGTQRLTAALGKSRAMKLILAGAFMKADEAAAAGLVAEVVEDSACIGRAVELASVIAAKPPLAVRLAKEAVLKACEAPLAAGLAFERKAFALLFATEDHREGVDAFLEKRPPHFRGK